MRTDLVALLDEVFITSVPVAARLVELLEERGWTGWTRLDPVVALLVGVNILVTGYRLVAHALTALLGGEVDAAVADPLATLPHIKSGKLRALAVTSAKRASALPDVPTVAESGVPGYEAASWAGIVVPKATPAPVVDALYKAFDKALKAPEVSSRLSSQLYEPVGMGPKEFARFAAAENEKWGKLIKQLNVKLD